MTQCGTCARIVMPRAKISYGLRKCRQNLLPTFGGDSGGQQDHEHKPIDRSFLAPHTTMWYRTKLPPRPIVHATSDASSSCSSGVNIAPVANAWSKSAIKSPISSMPTEMRTRSSGKSRFSPTSGGTLACDIHPGRLIVELTLPKLTQILYMRVASTIRRDNSFDPVVKLKTAPAPRACLRCSR